MRILDKGDTVYRRPVTFGYRGRESVTPDEEPMRGRVVYIHPRGRFHAVRFDCGVVECFQGDREE